MPVQKGQSPLEKRTLTIKPSVRPAHHNQVRRVAIGTAMISTRVKANTVTKQLATHRQRLLPRVQGSE
jgi:hypothetical protein